MMDSFQLLEKVTNQCKEHSTFRFWHPEHGYIPFHCGSWRCDSCAPVKAENVASRMVVASYQNDLTRHLALTLDPKKVVGEPWAYLQKVWNKLRVYLWRIAKTRKRLTKWQKIIRKHGLTWQKVVQIQPGTGLPHYHIMLSAFIPFAWMKEAWQTLGGGSVYLRYVDIQTVSGFIKGYFTRQVLNQDFPKYKRRYSTSHNISLKMPKKGDWKLRQWVSAPNYSKKGYYTDVERVDFIFPPGGTIRGAGPL